MVKLGEIATHENGKTLSSAEKVEEGEYDVMGGGMTYIGKTNKFNREGDTISISKSGASAGFVAFHRKKYWAGDCLTMIPKTPECDIRYLYYYMKLNSHLTTSTVSGSTIPHCKWDDIKDISVPLPPLDFQHALVARLDALQSQLTALESLQRHSEDNARFILESYLYTDSSVADGTQASSASEEDDEKEELCVTSIVRSTPIRRPRSVSPARASENVSAAVAEDAASAVATPDYESMSLAALKELVKARGLRGLSGKKKEELVAILRDVA